MKKNPYFKIDNMLWPGLILIALIIAAIWTNAGITQKPAINWNTSPGLLMPPQADTQPQASTQPSNMQTALMLQEEISQVIAGIKPSVVGVSRLTNPTETGNTNGLTYLEPYLSTKGLMGTGVIVDNRGYVITTFQTVGKDHIVKISMFSSGNREYEADVMAVDSQTDLVLLKIRSQEIFPACVLGNSDLVEVGDIVFAIGSPFGFSRTVTMGIISSRSRQLNLNGIQYPDMFQTDAAVNQGNDGGPLVDIKGHVIGINMACFMPDNHFTGIGFAIPINHILVFMNTR
ncbi:MAG: trypsin-like peptidase domain-containing protein [Desulfobacterales bacterium]|nr:trypsin-like peptidase domain-containing protein [Desulfobacterales bacterium]